VPLAAIAIAAVVLSRAVLRTTLETISAMRRISARNCAASLCGDGSAAAGICMVVIPEAGLRFENSGSGSVKEK
jgi:hypothetical protein